MSHTWLIESVLIGPMGVQEPTTNNEGADDTVVVQHLGDGSTSLESLGLAALSLLVMSVALGVLYVVICVCGKAGQHMAWLAVPLGCAPFFTVNQACPCVNQRSRTSLLVTVLLPCGSASTP
jgi:hypothetical protein